MKKVILYIYIFLSITTNTNSEMSHSTSKDEFKGTTSHYIMADLVGPNTPLSFPYNDTKSTLVVGCQDNNYWAYVYFTEVNLTDGKINDGYTLFTLEVKAGGSFTKYFCNTRFWRENIRF